MGDLISRSMLLEEMDKKYAEFEANCQNTPDYEDAFAIIDVLISELTTVDAVPVVHGEWIKGDCGEWQCSECREENCYAYDENLKRFTDLYCPNCGAKMDGKKVQE